MANGKNQFLIQPYKAKIAEIGFGRRVGFGKEPFRGMVKAKEEGKKISGLTSSWQPTIQMS